MSSINMSGGRKTRSNKGKKRGLYKKRSSVRRPVTRSQTLKKRMKMRKVRSNKGKKRSSFRRGRGRTRSGRSFRK